MIKIKGRDRLSRRFAALGEAEKIAGRVLFVGADMMRAEAHRSISAGSVSGKGHVPSAPGEAPNRDTGHLQANLETSMPRPLVAEVRSQAEYAAALEFGTSRMSARPYMRPARDKVAPEVARLMAKEFGDHVKRKGG